MFTLLKMLIFGGATIITPTPIDIGTDGALLNPPQEIEAITGGAALYLDITSHISADDALESFKEIDKLFPKGCVTATLFSKEHEPVNLGFSGGAWGGKLAWLRLSSESGGLPTGVPFTSIKVSTCRIIKNTVVKWINYSK